MVTKAEPAFRAIVLGLGSIGLVWLAGCALPDYQPPQNNETTSVGGASASSSSSGEASTSSGGGQGGSGGGASSSSSASSSGNTTSSSSSSTSGGGGVETDCTNNADDDQDGDFDCADSDCNAGFECVPPKPPSGWAVFVRITEGNVGTNPAPCPIGSPDAQLLFFEPSPSACAPCDCMAQTTCTPPTISFYTTNQCAFGGTLVPPVAGSNCAPYQPIAGTFVKPNPPTPLTKDCSGSTGAQLNPDPWQKYVQACAIGNVGKGCESGNVCVPKVGSEYNNGVCIAAPGTHQCPAPFTKQYVLSQAWDDQRACTACTCDPAFVGCAGGSVSLNTATGCNGNDTTIPPEKCFGVDPNMGIMSVKSTPAQPVVLPGGCAQGGPIGSVVNKAPLTICCAN